MLFQVTGDFVQSQGSPINFPRSLLTSSQAVRILFVLVVFRAAVILTRQWHLLRLAALSTYKSTLSFSLVCLKSVFFSTTVFDF